MRILWISNNSTLPTAYGQQTGLFLPRIREAGHDVFLFAFAGCEGAPGRMADGTLVLPRLVDPYGNDVALDHASFVRPDVVVTLGDPHIFDPEIYGQLPWCAWAPIDGTPASQKTVRALRAARWIWGVSEFVCATLCKQGFSNVDYIPHGVSSKVFYPADRAAARDLLSRAAGADLSKKFIVAMNAANSSNPSRKGFYEAFAAFAAFAAEHPETVLYVHAEKTGSRGGENLLRVADLVGLEPGQIYFAPQYPLACGMLGTDYLRDVYNAADVYLSASHGEAFGVCSVEAQMCNCPVVASRNSAQTELCLTGELADTVPYMPSEGMLWERPLVPGLVRGLERVREVGESLRATARERILKYDADTVFQKYMKPALNELLEKSREHCA